MLEKNKEDSRAHPSCPVGTLPVRRAMSLAEEYCESISRLLRDCKFVVNFGSPKSALTPDSSPSTLSAPRMEEHGLSAFSASLAANEEFKVSEKAWLFSECIFNTSWLGGRS
jgi:hypothetical protein